MAFVSIAATEGGKTYRKGEIISARDNPNFGRRERLPTRLRLEVTGASKQDIWEFMLQWKDSIFYTLEAENAAGWRVKLEIDPVLIAAAGISAEVKQRIKTWLLEDHDGNWVGTQFDQSSTHITLDIAKGQTFGLPEIKADVNAFFEDRLQATSGFHQHHFAEANVDTIVASGTILEAANEDPDGNIPQRLYHRTMTKAEAIAIIVDRLNP